MMLGVVSDISKRLRFSKRNNYLVHEEMPCKNDRAVRKSLSLLYCGYRYVDSKFNQGPGNLTSEDVQKIGWYGKDTLAVGYNPLNAETTPPNPQGVAQTFTAVGNQGASNLQVSFEDGFLRNVLGVTRIEHYFPTASKISDDIVYVLSRVDAFNAEGELVAVLRGSANYRLQVDECKNTVCMPVITWINFFVEIPDAEGNFANLEPAPEFVQPYCNACTVFPFCIPFRGKPNFEKHAKKCCCCHCNPDM